MAEHTPEGRTYSADDVIDAKFERVKHITLVLAALLFNMAFVVYCLYIVIFQIGSPDNIRWSTSILAFFAGGLISYLISRTRRR